MAKRQRPNFLVFITDQHRYDTLGYTGLSPCRTPHLDRLAREGTTFDRCYTPCPLCLPARSALFSGLYPHTTGLTTNSSGALDRPLLPEFLNDNGYHTIYSGKWHLGTQEGAAAWKRWGGEVPAYRKWCEEHAFADSHPHFHDKYTFRFPDGKGNSNPVPGVLEGRSLHCYDSWIADRTIEFLEDLPDDQPFFSVCSFHGPHPPLVVPQAYYDLYNPELAAEPANFAYDMKKKPVYQRDGAWSQLARSFGSEWADWQKSLAVYWGYVTFIDELIGRVLGRLDALDLHRDTIVMMCSDHGEMMGSHGLWMKSSMYEESLRVPWIIWNPERIVRRQISEPVSLVDLVPTVMGFAGVQCSDLHGTDLSSFVTGTGAYPTREPVVAEYTPGEVAERYLNDPPVPHMRCVVGQRYKYVYNLGDMDELYDLEDDPHEMNNRVDDSRPGGPLDELKAHLKHWMDETGDRLQFS